MPKRGKKYRESSSKVESTKRYEFTEAIDAAIGVVEEIEFAVLGLGGQDDAWYSGKHMAGVWFDTEENASVHQNAMHVVPVGQYNAMAVSPLSTEVTPSASG